MILDILKYIVAFILVIAIGFVAIYLLCTLFSLLEAYPIIILLIVLVGMNILSYYASFVWGQRKPWFFWTGLFLSLGALLLPLFA